MGRRFFVLGALYAAKFVAQSWPYATETLTLDAGAELPAWIDLQNTGTQSWNAQTRLGTTGPRDRLSPFVAFDWISSTRLAAAAASVPAGATQRFAFTFRAPLTPGVYDEHFSLVQEGVTWFGDGGLPADLTIEAKFVVLGGGDGGGSGPEADAGVPDAGSPVDDDAGIPDAGDPGYPAETGDAGTRAYGGTSGNSATSGVSSGCSAAPGVTPLTGLYPWLLVISAIYLGRKQRPENRT